MCGIAGIYNYAEPDRPVDGNLLARMTRALQHRGPDDEGFYCEGPIGLGHRRLSIVDLSPTGHQPMATADGLSWIAYNGEFYNHAEFRQRLRARGHHFRGTSDTETLLTLLASDGPDALADISGIFGFAFWDSRNRRLTLARDPLGVKQLYYHDDGHRIVFASEIKALLHCPDVPRDPDTVAINQYLHFHTPLFERTFFRNIRQLRQGEYLQVSRYGSRSRRYWSVQDFTPFEDSAEHLVEVLRDELSNIVGQQLMSDVPVGSFFSGGIDSSSIAAYASKHGKRPTCFGVHFSDQGVPDERPYQEAAAKALGLDLQLTTLDGSTFRDDLFRLLYHQDQPVIGAAMFPMAYVSKLAASQVKVCLGGQGADEIFGGYARYALAHPAQVMSSWFRGRSSTVTQKGVKVSGNLGKQLGEGNTIRRLARNARQMFDWEGRYFDNFAKVPESAWAEVFAGPEFYDRRLCRQIFHETVTASPAEDPATKVMHWDLQTYLPGLFHQDDRMSMAASLESRVPIADPRLVKFAFRVRFDAKFRGGASKWILRQAVSDVLPQTVINRRKVGFDTPAQSWMQGKHAAFVKEVLLSRESRQRGFWNIDSVESWLSRTNARLWFDVLWKILCIETWATIFLDQSPESLNQREPYVLSENIDPAERTSGEPNQPKTHNVANYLQEGRELGVRRTVARAVWELKTRTGLVRVTERSESPAFANCCDDTVPMRIGTDPCSVRVATESYISTDTLGRLRFVASEATRGRILCFSHWYGDFGHPIDWQLNPKNGKRWTAGGHWSESLKNERLVGDVKLTWEAARFPQAFHMARAAAFTPAARKEFSVSLFDQIESFIDSECPGFGVHWNSSQEIVLRLIAWSFALDVFEHFGHFAPEGLAHKIKGSMTEAALHLGRNIEYARDSVYNNHLISEAIGLYFLGRRHTDEHTGKRLQAEGGRLLTQQAEVQFYPDGSYIMHSHNYHRAVVQSYLWAISCDRNARIVSPPEWLKAVERSLDFLVAHQNPEDGSLPNFGANDGSLPLPLSTCEFPDFRPTLQAASVITRGERIYDRGPWDEMTAWLFGAKALDLPLKMPKRKSVSFQYGGYQALRGREERTFATFRCGSLRDRFSQIDMLHLDVWWKGNNVLVDGGSYLYNGPQQWHDHFYRTAIHNTIKVDNRDQMVHLRRFKTVHQTKAKLLRFEEHQDWSLCAGEHYAFQRYIPDCVHKRSILFVKDDLWVVVDKVTGSGTHNVMVHWLAGQFAYRTEDRASVCLETPQGIFSVSAFKEDGTVLEPDVAAGQSSPPRGWISRYYATKVAVPSIRIETLAKLPFTSVSVLCSGVPRIAVNKAAWSIVTESCSTNFEIDEQGVSGESVQVVGGLVCANNA
jgi:asparagine synthase (glutamine-hydrolysing)